jgi:uncharacterized membrane protein YgdD (TMEM256/DUF423 family)
MESTFTALAAIFGFLGIALGAFGAHSLERYFEQNPGREGTFKTGVQYHQIHALALLGVAWASGRWSSSLIPAAGYLFVLGILLFSGSLYLLSVTNRRWLGTITPLGGLAFLAGWGCLLIGVL